MADLQKLVDDLSTLTVLEAADLAKMLALEPLPTVPATPEPLRRCSSSREPSPVVPATP